MSRETIAIAYASNPDEAQLWCSFEKKDDHTRFSVINGAWEGILKDGTVYIRGSSHTIPAMIVWQGIVPSKYANDYNAALQWINMEIVGVKANKEH